MLRHANAAAVLIVFAIIGLAFAPICRAEEPPDVTKARLNLEGAQKDLDAMYSNSHTEDETDADAEASAARDAADKAQQKAQQDEDAAAKAEADKANNVPSKPGEPTTDQKAADARKQADDSFQKAADAEKKAQRAEKKADNDPKAGPIHKAIRKQRKKVRDLQRKLRDAMKKNGMLAMNLPGLPPADTALAAMISAGKVKAVATGTGQTIGYIANVSLTNLTDQPVNVTIPPTMLVSTDGKSQNYAVPQPTSVALKPGQTATVPLDGVCVNAHRPPAGNDTPGNLAVMDPSDPQVATMYGPQIQAVHDVVAVAHDLQAEGKFHTPFSRDPEKEIQTVIQQTVWAANPANDGRATTKEDLAKKVYERVGATTDDAKKKLQPGIDSIWDAVQLTGAKAKVIEVADNTTGGAKSEAHTETPPSETPKTSEKPTKFKPPADAKNVQEGKTASGDRTVTYDDDLGHHTVTIDKDGSYVDHIERNDDKRFPNGDHPTTTREKTFDADGNKTGSWSDHTTYDDKGDPKETTHDDFDRNGNPTGGYRIRHEYDAQRFVKRTVIEKYDKDHKVTNRTTQEVDEHSRPVLDRNENVDPNTGKTTGGSEEQRSYDGEGHMTPTYKQLP